MLFVCCVQALEISEESHDVNCCDLKQVTNFSLTQYNSMRTQALVEHSPDLFTLAEAYSVHKLLVGLRPTVESHGRDEWVEAFIPHNLHAPICNDHTRLNCSS